MPKNAPHVEAEIRRAIRDAMAIDPLISIRQLHKMLEKKLNRGLDPVYLGKLIKKVQKEIVVNIDIEKIGPRITTMREDFRLARENLLRIAYGQTNEGDMVRVAHKDQIAAWKAIGMLSKILLDAEMDLGIFDRHAPVADEAFRSRQLPMEVFEAMLKTAKVWKLPQDLTRKIEIPATITVESKEVPPAPPKTPPTPQNSPNQPTQDAKQKPKFAPTDIIPADPELRLS